jgi:alcohol dehydrogenase class IV
MINAFSFSSIPSLHFGARKISVLPSVIKTFGARVLLVTGARSFTSTEYGHDLLQQLHAGAIHVDLYAVPKEPNVKIIDDAVKLFHNSRHDVIIAIGGGSVLDAGKAIAAMLLLNESVEDYLEGVGSKPGHPGVKIPFIAVPTTSGTGSEATKNAVISSVGENGFKKSLRHNNFVPDIAIVDPLLTLSCPTNVTAASGMDAFTQLLESYLSPGCNVISDALALEGLKRIARSLLNAYQNGGDIKARTDMAMASYLSGITLANAGLGLVHGFASSIGGLFEIPHGVICSTLMAPVNKLTVEKLRSVRKDHETLNKYAVVGKIFSEVENKSSEYYTDYLLELIEKWSVEMNIPKLSFYNVTHSSFKKIANITENKNNPIAFNQEEMVIALEGAA